MGLKIKRFEDIEGWQEARVLAQMVYAVSSKGRLARDFRLRAQIEDAAASVMANSRRVRFGVGCRVHQVPGLCPAFGQRGAITSVYRFGSRLCQRG